MRKVLILLGIVLAAVWIYSYYQSRPQNIILITVDTLRADHMSTYGYPRETSPAVTARAKNAIVFERAFVQWPKTVPSMVSMFTSTYARTNGILFGSRNQYIPDTLTMLPEILRKNGFTTYGIVSNAVLAGSTNFSQGFDVYKETWLDTSRGEAHSRADHVTDFAIKALNELRGKKFFLWIHYVDPHYQYRPPAPFNGIFVGDRYYKKDRILKVNAEDNNYYDGIAKRIWNLDSKDQWDFYIAQYDAEIRYLDHHLERLFGEFDKHKLWRNSIICFTSDHGESLGENHYFFEHGWFPYTSCSHVPLIFWEPNGRAKRITTSVGLIDLVPSLLKKIRVAAPSSLEGQPWDFRKPRPVFVEAGEGGLTRFSYIRSIWVWPHHLVYVPSKNYQKMMKHNLLELYNVEKDWYESENIIHEAPDKTKELEHQLLSWIKSAPSYTPPSKKIPDYDPEAIEQMEALGYTQ